MTSRINSSSTGVGSRVYGTSSGTYSSKPVASLTRSTVTPGCREARRIEWSGVAKSKTPRSVTTRGMRWKRVALGPAAAARSYPTPHTMSTFGTKTRVECFGIQ